MSHDIATLIIAPIAKPFTSATVGFGIVCNLPLVAQPLSASRCAASSFVAPPPVTAARSSAIAFTSPPAENARPLPVSATQRTAESRVASSSAATNRSIISLFIAFRRSGRLNVISATPSSRFS